MSEEEQLVGTLIKIESNRQVEFIPNEYSRHVIDSDGLAVYATQPQLTIPKSIADEVDENGLDPYVIQSSLPKDSYLIPEWEPLVDLSDKFIKWSETTEKWWAILDAYLAGKALGVDLVKVVEG